MLAGQGTGGVSSHGSSHGHAAGFHKNLNPNFCSGNVPDNCQNMLTCGKQHQQPPVEDKIKPFFLYIIYTILYYFIKVPKEVRLAALGNFLGAFRLVFGALAFVRLGAAHSTPNFLPVGKIPGAVFSRLSFLIA